MAIYAFSYSKSYTLFYMEFISVKSMAMKFAKDWDRPERESIFGRIGGIIHTQPPLKERLSNSIYRIRVIESKLDQLTNKMETKNRELFERCTAATSEHDHERAAMYANECAQVRKMTKTVLRSRLALEQVVLRLETVQEFGNLAVEMSPLANVVHSLKGHLTGIMPEVSYELGVIGDTLNGLVVEAGEATGTSYDIEASSEEAHKILNDAGAVAEQRMKETFPELPIPGVPSSEKQQVTR
jgi:division protein CdvB (Snf7/Vps24/ESCRT-III family)